MIFNFTTQPLSLLSFSHSNSFGSGLTWSWSLPTIELLEHHGKMMVYLDCSLFHLDYCPFIFLLLLRSTFMFEYSMACNSSHTLLFPKTSVSTFISWWFLSFLDCIQLISLSLSLVSDNNDEPIDSWVLNMKLFQVSQVDYDILWSWTYIIHSFRIGDFQVTYVNRL